MNAIDNRLSSLNAFLDVVFALAFFRVVQFLPALHEQRLADFPKGLFDFRITQYTTDEDVQKFAQLVKDQGTDALRRVLEKEDQGRLAVTGSTGNQIAIARKRTQGADTIITIITARNMPFIELYNNGRTTDYPFGYLQVKLDAQGKGGGQIMAAAKIRFDKKKGQYQIESFGNQYIKAVNVRPNK
jgi:hypothetical protein